VTSLSLAGFRSGRHKVFLVEAGGSDRRFMIRMPIGYGLSFSDGNMVVGTFSACVAFALLNMAAIIRKGRVPEFNGLFPFGLALGCRSFDHRHPGGPDHLVD
jgi:hypothetical protein